LHSHKQKPGEIPWIAAGCLRIAAIAAKIRMIMGR
jgi:hypothetical protein